MIVDLIRHGSTGRERYLDGHGDYRLTETGRAQMLRQVTTAVWASVRCSPLQRAREAAEAAASRLSLPLAVDPDWSEIDFGAWEGRERVDLVAELAAFHANPVAHPPPGGERWETFSARIGRALNRVLDEDSSPALVVAHGGPIRMALTLACGLSYQSLWCLRLGYGTRVRLEIGRDDAGRPWGEILELSQP